MKQGKASLVREYLVVTSPSWSGMTTGKIYDELSEELNNHRIKFHASVLNNQTLSNRVNTLHEFMGYLLDENEIEPQYGVFAMSLGARVAMELTKMRHPPSAIAMLEPTTIEHDYSRIVRDSGCSVLIISGAVNRVHNQMLADAYEGALLSIPNDEPLEKSVHLEMIVKCTGVFFNESLKNKSVQSTYLMENERE